MMTKFRDNFWALVESANNIVITSHISPDDDSIGSVLSVYTILKNKYPDKNVRIIYTGQEVSRYNIFHNFDKIEWVDDVANHLDGCGLLIVNDGSNYSRFSKFPELLQNIPKSIAIDHHKSTPDHFTLLQHKPEFSSNTELIYRSLIEGQDYSKPLAEYLLLGIVGDTGCFAYVSPSQTDVFVLAKDLINKVGMPIDQFRARYMGIPQKIIPLLQELVKNAVYTNLDNWPPFQYTFISNAVAIGFSDEDLSAASHIYMSQYLPRVEGYAWGFVITPRSDGGCRISSRSLPESVNVNDLHTRLEVGGGHVRASGGSFKDILSSEECIQKVLEFMKNNNPVLS